MRAFLPFSDRLFSARSRAGARGDGGALLREPRRRSFTDELPWRDYSPETKSFVLEDGKSVGAVWEAEPIGAEGRSDAYKSALCRDLLGLISGAVPEIDPAPWVMQIYLSDEPDLSFMAERFGAYGPAARDGNAFSRRYAGMAAAHLQRTAREGGLFEDKVVTDGRWRGRRRRVRIVLYRRLGRRRPAGDLSPEEELAETAANVELALKAAGVAFRRYDGAAFYEWMTRWFNPAPPIAGGDVSALLALAPYPGDDDLPFGRDFAELLLVDEPSADTARGVIRLSGAATSIVTTLGLKRAPDPGHFTGDRTKNNRGFALADKLPEGTTLVMTVVFQPRDVTENQIASVEDDALGTEAGASLAKEEARLARLKLAKGDDLYPLEIAAFVQGKDISSLQRARRETASLLHQSGLHAIDARHELLLIDRWLENLPMAYCAAGMKARRRARLHFASHIAQMLPLIGRSRGTGNPGLLFFNRGGEPFAFDPLSKSDRAKNAHLLLLGPTGAGKSATLVSMLMSITAAHRPRLFIIERGRSFNLLGAFFAREGLTVNALDLRPGCHVSLPPFADAFRLLDPKYDHEYLGQTAGSLDASDKDEEREDHRDILGELEIIARLMITGGEAKEDARLHRDDRLIIREAILAAARAARQNGAPTVRPAHIVEALDALANAASRSGERRARIKAMADAMALFADPRSIAGDLFNRDGAALPDCDVTLVDLGALANDGNEGELAVAYISLINRITALVERDEYDARPTLVVTDEGHLITTNPLLARYVVKITKMWRKLGAWFWLATQNLADFPDASEKMLNMAEFWLLLTMPKDEVEQVARFKELDAETKALLLSARKEDGKYTEGVILSDRLQSLVRIAPPSIALALAQTEKHEKARRAALMKEGGLASELEAADIIAAEIDAARSSAR